MYTFFEEVRKLDPHRKNYTWIVTEVPVEGHGKAEGVTARPGEKLLTSGDEIVWASDPEGFLVKAWKTGQGLPSQCRMESGEAGAGTGQGGLSQCRMESGETGVKAGREIRTGVYTVDGVSVYAEAMGAEQHIVICGGGHIAAAMIRMAKMTDFRVTVIEDREELEAPSYEAGADTVLIGNYTDLIAGLDTDDHTWFVVMTRDHLFDRTALGAALRKPSAYVGMIGSRRKNAVVFGELRKQGFGGEDIRRVHAPVGLAIGAETPEEIAVSIIAQIIEIKNSSARNEGYTKPLLKALLARPRAVLVTLIRKNGSAPRHPGAKMLVYPDGKITGTIGGGKGEGDVIRIAREMLSSGEASLDSISVRHIDMSFSGEAASEGETPELICGGSVDVLLELL